MNEEQLSPGTVLADKYRLESVLGEGGMGTVYRAEHLALRAPVAVKVIDRKVDEGDVTMSRFMREAQSAAALRSPHVVQILDYGTDQGRPFMVMELLEGEPLADRLKRVKRLGAEDTYQIILHVAKAVSKAHEAEIVHRDLKPDNIFLVHNEGDEIAKVLDFGVAKVEATALNGEGHTRTGSLLGTPYYMSPEQAQGNKDVDGRSDLWALGVIAFECLTGSRPFSSDGLGDLVLQICIRDIPVPSERGPVPVGFDAWFKKACEREPEDRFQSARELAEALRAALEIDSGVIPESRWVPTVDRITQARGNAPSAAEISTIDESDAKTVLEEQPSSARSSARPRASAVTPALANEGGVERESSNDWRVVPHGTMEEQPASSRPSIDPLAQTYEPPKSTPIGFVAVLAILLGGGLVFGLKQFGVLDLNSSAPSDDKPLKVISTQSKKKSEPTLEETTEPNPAGDSETSKKKKSADSAEKREKSSATDDDSDTATDSSTEDEGEEPVTSEEAARLEQIEKEALEGVVGTTTAGSTPREGTTREGAPKDAAATDFKGDEDSARTKSQGPQPVLPPELKPVPPPADKSGPDGAAPAPPKDSAPAPGTDPQTSPTADD